MTETLTAVPGAPQLSPRANALLRLIEVCSRQTGWGWATAEYLGRRLAKKGDSLATEACRKRFRRAWNELGALVVPGALSDWGASWKTRLRGISEAGRAFLTPSDPTRPAPSWLSVPLTRPFSAPDPVRRVPRVVPQSEQPNPYGVKGVGGDSDAGSCALTRALERLGFVREVAALAVHQLGCRRTKGVRVGNPLAYARRIAADLAAEREERRRAAEHGRRVAAEECARVDRERAAYAATTPAQHAAGMASLWAALGVRGRVALGSVG